MTDARATARNRAVDVYLDDDTAIRVGTHGPHRVGGALCIAVCTDDDAEAIHVTVSAAGALVEWGAPGVRGERVLSPLTLDGGPCVACAVRDAVGRAVVAMINPSDPTPQQVALHATLDDLTALMPGHDHAEETP